MTVKQLIEVLQREPQDAEILLGITEQTQNECAEPLEYKFVHYEVTDHENDEMIEFGAEYDGMSTYASKDSKTIVLRPNVNRIKIVS